MKRLRAAAVGTLLVGYLAAFYCAGLRNELGLPIRDESGNWLSRLDRHWPWLLPPGELPAVWFGTPPQFSLVDRLPVLLVAAAVLLLAWAAGRLIVRQSRRRKGILAPDRIAFAPNHASAAGLSRLEIFVFSLAAGLNLASTWVLLLGLFGHVGRFWLFTLPATLTVLGTAGMALRRSGGRAVSPEPAWQAGSLPCGAVSVGEAVIGVRWLWAALPFLLLLVLSSVLPPLDFDVCEYHLQAPKEFFEHGRIGFLPHNVYANMPMGAEMLSLLAMSIAGDWWTGVLAGKLITAMFTPLCALGLLAAGRRFYSTSAGVAAALLYLSVPWLLLDVSSAGLIDGVLACYLFLALYAVMLWTDGEDELQREVLHFTSPGERRWPAGAR